LLQVERLLTHKWGQVEACVHGMRQKACPWRMRRGRWKRTWKRKRKMKAHKCGH